MSQYVPSRLKVSNRKIVYRLLSSVGTMSRAEISRQTGISGATVLKIIDYFVDNNIAVYDGIDSTVTTVGRKPTNLRFNPDFAYTVAVLLEGNYVNIGILNMEGEIKYLVSKTKITNFFDFLDLHFSKMVHRAIEDSGINKEKIIGLGLGLPGVIDSEKGIIHTAPLVGIHQEYDFSQYLKALTKECDLPIFIENDVNAAAYGEYKYRFDENGQDLIFISVGTGVGSGIIMDGKIRHGAHNFAGEIGYMCFDRKYSYEPNQPGWLESMINLDAFKRKYGYTVESFMEPKTKAHIISDITEYLSLSIANISAVLDVDLVVMGGLLCNYLGKDLIQSITSECIRLCVKPPEIQKSKCEEVGIVGLGCIVSEKLLTSILKEDQD